eukprot:4296152-Amphidinium_carterae.1
MKEEVILVQETFLDSGDGGQSGIRSQSVPIPQLLRTSAQAGQRQAPRRIGSSLKGSRAGCSPPQWGALLKGTVDARYL